MSPPEYLTCCFPTPYTVLGLKLRPLSLGHLVAMQWQGLSYVAEWDQKADRPPSLDDLISACLICSMTFRGYQEFLQGADLQEQLKELGKSLDLGAIESKQDLFACYLSEGLESPEIEVPSGVSSGVLMGTPWLQCLRLCLMSRLHVPSEDTWDYSYRQALWDCFSLRESEGKLTINGGQADTPAMQEDIETLQALNQAFLEEMGRG